MSDYIKREDAIEYWKNADYIKLHSQEVNARQMLDLVPSADVVEVGKPYPREEFEKYGLSEWKDKHGQRWVMIERRDNERK